jgi:hypothetical protein
MEQMNGTIPFDVGALYRRREEIHDRLGGQRQGGISTPAETPFVIIFTGEAGIQHGYHDRWDDEGALHYYGEGQKGDMLDRGGNRAIREHLRNNKRLLLFQAMGRGLPYRFLGEFRFQSAYERSNVPDTEGKPRVAIVFKLKPVEQEFNPFQNAVADLSATSGSVIDMASTTSAQIVTVRAKQALFRRRLISVEKHCRLTGIEDLRFLRASHVKPWAKCASGGERVDGNNGLLLTPHADFLFDRGWISFDERGRLLRSRQLPMGVVDRMGLNLKVGRSCGSFSVAQNDYLNYHRNSVFEKAFKRIEDPLIELIATTIS